MSVDRVKRRRLELERADVTTGAVGSEDSTLVNCRTSGRVARIDRRAAGKERDRRGGPAKFPNWPGFGLGVFRLPGRVKFALALGAKLGPASGRVAKQVIA